MSAVITLAQRDAIHVLTDTAATDGRNRLLAFSQKYAVVEGANSIVAFRGTAGMFKEITRAISDAGFWSFDEMQNGIETLLKSLARERGLIWGDTKWEIHVAGWSHLQNRGSFFSISSHGTAGGIPYAVAPESFLPLNATPGNWDIVSVSMELLSPLCNYVYEDSRSDVETALLSIIKMQRQMFGNIGGTAKLVTITKDGLSERDLFQWPDQVGALMDGVIPAECTSLDRSDEVVMAVNSVDINAMIDGAASNIQSAAATTGLTANGVTVATVTINIVGGGAVLLAALNPSATNTVPISTPIAIYVDGSLKETPKYPGLDNGGGSYAAAPFTIVRYYSGLSAGNHTFELRCADVNGSTWSANGSLTIFNRRR